MRATILPYAIRLTKAHTATVSMTTKGCIVAGILPLKCFLFLLPKYIHVYAIMMQQFSYLDKGKYCNRNTPDPQYSPRLTSSG